MQKMSWAFNMREKAAKFFKGNPLTWQLLTFLLVSLGFYAFAESYFLDAFCQIFPKLYRRAMQLVIQAGAPIPLCLGAALLFSRGGWLLQRSLAGDDEADVRYLSRLRDLHFLLAIALAILTLYHAVQLAVMIAKIPIYAEIAVEASKFVEP